MSIISCVKFSKAVVHGKLLTSWGELSHNFLALFITRSKVDFPCGSGCDASIFIVHEMFGQGFRYVKAFGLEVNMFD
ncbi:hypothetical protein HanXRQr2_Chr12g0547941 [Helianthus annuus]|uniref:Uncharacterized protein n=1 Tax=Helianthus annuus TaxID=4232 RepID=A0A9K3MWG9_HELAN|nr:hypothetical protein HanXRQr2_Chr12g0547941 [Helianthus annuus]KAJ0863220.1 hypothetical protein HanPSC8_Chr12g0527441 [Helianthus annuus]